MKISTLGKVGKFGVLTLFTILLSQGAVFAYKSPMHIFHIDDVMRGYEGSTYGPAGTISRPFTFCGVEAGNNPCPPEVQPQQDDGTTLYPIDSQFGYYTADMVGAQEKPYDLDYREGFAGNITEGGFLVGLRVLNAASDFYKARAPMGTWCRSTAGEYVKCDSEHYTVMEHALTCHEVIPYLHADPLTGAQGIKAFPDGSASFDCANGRLDDEVYIIAGGAVTGSRLTDATPGVQMDPNANTTLLDDLAVSSDYSIRLQKDGAPVYGWGNAIRMQNDVRLYAKLPLPAEWKAPGADFPVNSAKLVIKHGISDNAGDLVRPEDLENDGATGRTPSFTKAADGSRNSLTACVEGDGDPIEAGRFLLNNPFKVDGTDPSEPLPFTDDLTNALTNAWYASLDRDPFEWAYRATNPDPAAFEYIGSALPDPGLGVLASGPQWMLKSSRYSGDLAGVPIPAENCTLPAAQDGAVKYRSGTGAVTVINLLDWDEEAEGAPSPLATSVGWVDVTQNGFVEIAGVVNGIPVTTEGLPMTEDFDLALHIREEMQPISLYSVQLFINEEPTATDMAIYGDSGAVAITEFNVPIRPPAGSSKRVTLAVTNTGTSTIPEVDLVVSNDVQGVVYTASYSGLAPDEVKTFAFKWTAPTEGSMIYWSAKVLVDGVEVDEATAESQLR